MVLFRQVAFMLIFMGVGAILYCGKIITDRGSAEMGKLLLYVVIPSVVVRSFVTEYSEQKLLEFGVSFLLALLSLVLAIVISMLAFRKPYGMERFAASYVALLNILQWTFGMFMMSGDRHCIRWKKIVTNPIVCSLLVGMVIFLLPVSQESFLYAAVRSAQKFSDSCGYLPCIVAGGRQVRQHRTVRFYCRVYSCWLQYCDFCPDVRRGYEKSSAVGLHYNGAGACDHSGGGLAGSFAAVVCLTPAEL